MIPTAIVAAFVLGVWVRWWAVPIVALVWGLVVALGNSATLFAGVAIGEVNALVGVLLAIGLRRAFHIPKSAPFHRT